MRSIVCRPTCALHWLTAIVALVLQLTDAQDSNSNTTARRSSILIRLSWRPAAVFVVGCMLAVASLPLRRRAKSTKGSRNQFLSALALLSVGSLLVSSTVAVILFELMNRGPASLLLLAVGAFACFCQIAAEHCSGNLIPGMDVVTICGLCFWSIGLGSIAVCFWPERMRLELWLALIFVGAASITMGMRLEGHKISGTWSYWWTYALSFLQSWLVVLLGLGGVSIILLSMLALAFDVVGMSIVIANVVGLRSANMTRPILL